MSHNNYADQLLDKHFKIIFYSYSAEKRATSLDLYEKAMNIAKQCAILSVQEMQGMQVNNPQNWGASGAYFQMVLNELYKK